MACTIFIALYSLRIYIFAGSSLKATPCNCQSVQGITKIAIFPSFMPNSRPCLLWYSSLFKTKTIKYMLLTPVVIIAMPYKMHWQGEYSDCVPTWNRNFVICFVVVLQTVKILKSAVVGTMCTLSFETNSWPVQHYLHISIVAVKIYASMLQLITTTK